MKLTADLFANIVSSLTSDAMMGRAYEKRLAPRAGLRVRLTIAVVTQDVPGPPFTVWVRDVSRNGIGLVCPQRLPAGTRFVAQLPRGDKDVLAVTFRVVQCRSLMKELFHVGAVSEPAANDEARL
jgi:hypothetical protein